MAIWPFTRPSPSLRLRSLRRDVDELQAELIDLRETLEKVFAGIRKVQGKVNRRKRTEMDELAGMGEPENHGAEPQTLTPGPQLAPAAPPFDPRADMRARAALLRMRR